MITSNGKFLTSSYGKLLKSYDLPKLTFVNRGEIFPKNSVSNAANITIVTEIINVIYIDFGDGSEFYEREFTGSLSVRSSEPLHTYSVNGDHSVKIWFKYPSKIKQITASYWNVVGEFPVDIQLYNMNRLSFNQCRWDSFPMLRGAVIYYLSFSNSFINNQEGIPEGLLTSAITTLFLGQEFKFDRNNNINRLIDIRGITSVTFTGYNNISFLPSNLKDVTTLRNLALGNNGLTIDENIRQCTQLESLSFGYYPGQFFGSSIGDGDVTSYGVGIAGMTSLKFLGFGMTPNIPATAPLGIENAQNLKTLYFRSSFRTLSRLESFISDIFGKVINNASLLVGNTLLRQVRLEVCWVNSVTGIVPRPTGTYQAPTGYIQGSSNGTPASPMEMIYVLVKQYRWTILVQNTANNGIETLTP